VRLSHITLTVGDVETSAAFYADQTYLWREAVLRDPDETRIFIFHAGDNRLNPPWRLQS
jgi:catechol 2,3-dioxygenase-like lactoylglutathione lyase family enzyme